MNDLTRTNRTARRAVMLNSGVECRSDLVSLTFAVSEVQEESMLVTRFQGIDRHKNYSTVSVLECDGHELWFVHSCSLGAHISSR